MYCSQESASTGDHHVREISQTEKDKYHTCSLICRIHIKKINTHNGMNVKGDCCGVRTRRRRRGG
jgi:hypothetical protein